MQDSDGGCGLGDFDRVVDVADDGPAGGFGEVSDAFEAEGWWQVCCYCLDLVAGGSIIIVSIVVSMCGKVDTYAKLRSRTSEL